MTRTFKIERPDEAMRPTIQDKIDNLNKPKGSLGALEELAMQMCLIQLIINELYGVKKCQKILGLTPQNWPIFRFDTVFQIA